MSVKMSPILTACAPRWAAPLRRGLGALALLACLLPPLPGRAAPPPTIPNHDLRGFGVKNLDQFRPTMISPDGRRVWFWEDMPRGQRAGGVMAALWEFRFRSDGVLADWRRLPLPVPNPSQVVLTPEGSGAVVMAREGASFWHLDFASGAVREFVTPGVGKTRFISEPRAMWVEQGRLWVAGYPLSREGVRSHHTLATLDPSQSGEAALTLTGVDLDEVLAGFRPWLMQRFLSPSLGFAAGTREGRLEVCTWKPGTGLVPFARFKEISSAWTGGHVEFVTGTVEDGSSVGVIHDADSGQTWTLPPAPAGSPYDYPLISEGGEVLTVVRGAREASSMELLYGRREEGFQLRPVPGYARIPTGLLRLCPDGSRLVYRNTGGVHLIELPR